MNRRSRISKARLENLAGEATVDAYDEAEQAGGFFTMIEENLGAPFSTVVLGVEVTVKRIYLTEGDEIVAIRSRGKLARALRCAHSRRTSPPNRGSRIGTSNTANRKTPSSAPTGNRIPRNETRSMHPIPSVADLASPRQSPSLLSGINP